MAGPIKLRALVAYQADIGFGIARLDTATRESLGVAAGDFVKIAGRKTTAAVVADGHKEDEGRRSVRLEPVIRRNASISFLNRVWISRLEPPTAEAMAIAPIYARAPRLALTPGLNAFVAKKLTGRPFARGEVCIVPGVFLMGGSLLFMVLATHPAGTVVVGPSTQVTIREETVAEEEIIKPTIP